MHSYIQAGRRGRRPPNSCTGRENNPTRYALTFSTDSVAAEGRRRDVHDLAVIK